jgi:hypothetical protein
VVLTSVYVPANALRISCSVHRFSTPLTASGDAIANDAHAISAVGTFRKYIFGCVPRRHKQFEVGDIICGLRR